MACIVLRVKGLESTFHAVSTYKFERSQLVFFECAGLRLNKRYTVKSKILGVKIQHKKIVNTLDFHVHILQIALAIGLNQWN